MMAARFTGSHESSRGFALVATLALSVLLVVICVGLLTLSSVGLRTSERERARQTARSNARLAISLAIGQLQKSAGPDQRITAPAPPAAAAAEESSPGGGAAWCGVWRSDPGSSGPFDEGRTGLFESWLVSHGGGKSTFEDQRKVPASGTVTLATRPDGAATQVPLLAAPEGHLAWWTADESQKVPADLPAIPPELDGDRLAARHAPARPVAEGIEEYRDLPSEEDAMNGLLTPGQLRLAAPRLPTGYPWDLAVETRTVMSDVRNGGLKRDLSTLFELPSDKIPADYGVWRGRNTLTNDKVYLYGAPGVALGARWNHLYAFYNLSKSVDYSNGRPWIEPGGKLIDWNQADNYVSFGDDAGGFRFPRLAKIIYVFSYTSVRNPVSGGDSHQLQLATDIYVTLWNPFDVGIVFPANTSFFAKFSKGLPFNFQWQVNGVSRGAAVGLKDIISDQALFLESPFFNPAQGSLFAMAPGETLMFSMNGKTGTYNRANTPEFWPGVHFNGGVKSPYVLGGSRTITGNAGDKITVGLKPAEHGAAYTIDGQTTSQYLDFWIYDIARKWPYYEHRGEIIAQADTPFMRRLPAVDASKVPSATLGAVEGRKQPFAAFVMETKTALDSTVPVPAFLHSGIARLSSRVNSNAADFANERLEYKMEPLTGFDSDLIQVTLPSDPAGANHGYIGSGRLPATGQTHFLAHTIPATPPVSLATLRHAGVGDGATTLRATHWGFSSTPNAPFSDLAVGNSYAHPLLAADKAISGKLYDHCYLANQALWDSWFFSSLAPRPDDRFAHPGTMIGIWKSFTRREDRLLNPRFIVHPGGRSESELATWLFAGQNDGSLRPEAHRRIAAHLLLKGGFNINSTSVRAWTAFLSSTRQAPLRKLPKSGSGAPVELDPKGTVFSRTDYVLDDAVESSRDPASRYSGYRELSDESIARLAGAVVEQVKKRGPFLSLSEFVNRRLTTDSTLSLSGALQSAIDESGLNQEIAAGGVAGDQAPLGAAMANPAAATLSTAAGAPGWLMQGDILDPLGPFIAARGDTFRIRSYGDATGPNGEILARAWCEAVVQRVPDWLDPGDPAEIYPATRPVNRTFGRRFHVVSFRWLSGSEISTPSSS